ncbi:MAG TPA: PIN domain-containing protein [Thermoanaerobaculia bacterium]|nr:PIN domain-containing protein [Thermoanaerobaculia bacterium]
MGGRPKGLIDTGAILAIVNRPDRWHHSCMETLATLRLPLATSEAVLTELFHFLSHPRDIDAAWDFIHSGAVTVKPISDEDLPDLRGLMHRYRDRPMDFADATLVHLAQREQLDTVFTIDHNDFETYRIDGRRPFRILPQR